MWGGGGGREGGTAGGNSWAGSDGGADPLQGYGACAWIRFYPPPTPQAVACAFGRYTADHTWEVDWAPQFNGLSSTALPELGGLRPGGHAAINAWACSRFVVSPVIWLFGPARGSVSMALARESVWRRGIPIW